MVPARTIVALMQSQNILLAVLCLYLKKFTFDLHRLDLHLEIHFHIYLNWNGKRGMLLLEHLFFLVYSL